MIPKKIHYIWLGGKKKPKSFELALHSWRTFASKYEIIEWNENNITEFELPARYYELIIQKKWAFASDVLRFHILEKYGGLYFDIDQVLIKDIPESFLVHDFFISKYHQVDDYYGFGLVGSAKNGNTIKTLRTEMDVYCGPDIIVNKIGSIVINTLLQQNSPGLIIFPQEYFYPLTKKYYTSDTYSHHLSNTSWIPWWKKAMHMIPGYIHIQRVIKKMLPKSVREKIFKIDYL